MHSEREIRDKLGVKIMNLDTTASLSSVVFTRMKSLKCAELCGTVVETEPVWNGLVSWLGHSHVHIGGELNQTVLKSSVSCVPTLATHDAEVTTAQCLRLCRHDQPHPLVLVWRHMSPLPIAELGDAH